MKHPDYDNYDVKNWYALKKGGTPGAENMMITLLDLPTKNPLLMIYPNPFSDETVIHFSLEKTGPVNLSVFDQNGRFLENLLMSNRNMGEHEILWNKNNKYKPGFYFLRLETVEEIQVIKAVIY